MVGGEQQQELLWSKEQKQNVMFGYEQGEMTLHGNSTQQQKVVMREDGGGVGEDAAGGAIRPQCSR